MCICNKNAPDPAGGVMSDLVTQNPLWLPTVKRSTLAMSVPDSAQVTVTILARDNKTSKCRKNLS